MPAFSTSDRVLSEVRRPRATTQCAKPMLLKAHQSPMAVLTNTTVLFLMKSKQSHLFMKSYLYPIALALGVLCGCTTSQTEPPVVRPVSSDRSRIQVSALQDGEFIDVSFDSSGCYHRDKLTFTISSSNGVTSVAGFESSLRWSDAEREPLPANKGLGPLVLSHADCILIDKLLEYYRSDLEDGCTTVDQVKLTLISRTRGTVKENYEDGSCSTYDRRDILTFRALAQRMAKS